MIYLVILHKEILNGIIKKINKLGYILYFIIANFNIKYKIFYKQFIC